MFISRRFVDENELEVEPATSIIRDGAGKKLADRIGAVTTTIRNGAKVVDCNHDVMDMPDQRDLVIGLSHFPVFGYQIKGVPIKKPG